MESTKYRTLQTDCKTNYRDSKRASAREIFKYFNCTNYVATKFNYILLPKPSWGGGDWEWHQMLRWRTAT